MKLLLLFLLLIPETYLYSLVEIRLFIDEMLSMLLLLLVLFVSVFVFVFVVVVDPRNIPLKLG